MHPPIWSNNYSGPFPPRCQWNPQWVREQQQHHHQFAKYKQTKPLNRFNENYWCETCDRGFATQDLLDKHKQQHQKCNIDGCQFVAHPKVITKHIQMQHSTGLFKKIANLNNPEDIQKWITERKKRYPTKTNVEKKAAERKEKIERGEKIGLECNSRNGNRKRKLFDGEKKCNQKNSKIKYQTVKINKTRNFKTESAHKKNSKLIHQQTGDSESRKLKHFTGIRNLIIDSENEEDPEQGPRLTDDEEELQETARIEPKVCDALSSLISNYNESSEEEDTSKEYNDTIKKQCKENETQSIPLTKNSNKSSENIQEDKTQNILLVNKSNKSSENIQDDNGCITMIDDDSGPEEVKYTKSTLETIIPEQENCSKQDKIQGNKKIWNEKNHSKRNVSKQKVKPKLPSTLLQKLLHREVQQERNIVLQCVNYIVKHNFFDKPQ